MHVCFGQQVIWHIDFPFLVNCLCSRKHSEVILMRNSTTEVQVQYMQGRNQTSWSTQQFHDPPDEIIISAVGSRWHHLHPKLPCQITTMSGLTREPGFHGGCGLGNHNYTFVISQFVASASWHLSVVTNINEKNNKNRGPTCGCLW